MKFRIRDIDGNFVRDAVVTMEAKKGATTIVGPTPFAYDLPTEKYQFNWISPIGGNAKGVWQISYFKNYNTPTQTLIRGPEAEAIQAPYTYTLTLK
jgi:hypothetical protein